MSKKLLILSIIFNLLFVAGLFFLIQKLGGWSYVRFKMNHRGVAGVYEHKKQLHANLPITKNDIVFVGNSITAQCEWAELLSRNDIRNRGIDGDVTEGLLDRLNMIIQPAPRQLFLMIGINDLISHRPAKILERYEEIVKRIGQEAPATRLVLQSILPVNNDVRPSGMSNADIRSLNEGIQAIAKANELTYLDIHVLLADREGQLNANYTRDGIHINGTAYLIWKKAIEPVILDQL